MNTVLDIDDLWDFSDPARSEAKFLAALAEAEDESLAAEIQTQIARTYSLRRQFDEAHETLDVVASVLPRVDPRVEVRYLLERGRTWNSSGVKDKAREVFLAAFDAGKRVGDDNLVVDAAHMMAIVEEPEAALEWNLLGFRIVDQTQQEKARKWIGALSNNIAWTYHDTGDYETALQYFEKGLEYRRTVGAEPGLRIARWAVARCLRSLLRVEESLAEQMAIKDHYYPGYSFGSQDMDGYVVEEIAECLYALGRHDEARPYFGAAAELLGKDDWFVANEAKRLERLLALAQT